MKLQRSVAVLCTLALLATMALAQQPASRAPQPTTAKRPLTHQDYDSWRSIVAQQVSRDGKFVAYAYMPQDGDGEIIVRNIATGVDWRAPRGYRPPVPPPDDPSTNLAEFQAEQTRLLRPVFTADSKFVVFSTEPTKAEVNKAKKEKKKPEEMPKNGLSIMDLSNGTVTHVDRVKTFRVPEDGSGFIAYLMESTKPQEKSTDSNPAQRTEPSAVAPGNPEPGASPVPTEPTAPGNAEPGAKPESQRRSRNKKEYGTDLILHNTSTSTDRKFAAALAFTISKDAKTLVYSVSSHKEDTNGVYTIATDTEATPTTQQNHQGQN